MKIWYFQIDNSAAIEGMGVRFARRYIKVASTDLHDAYVIVKRAHPCAKISVLADDAEIVLRSVKFETIYGPAARP